MKYVPAGMSRLVGRQVLKAQKNSPTILFAVGVVGVVGTVVLASRATLRLEDEVLTPAEHAKNRLEIASKEHTSINRNQELAKIYVRTVSTSLKLYGPSLIVGVLSVAALTKSHQILNQRNGALTAAYAGLAKSFSEYRKAVAEEIGEEKEKDIYHARADAEWVEETPEGPVVVKGKKASRNDRHPYSFCFDETNKHWKRGPNYNQMFLSGQENWANSKLRTRGHIFLNEVLDSLGIERVPDGQIVGWLYEDPEGDGYVDFGIFKDGGFDGTRFVNGEEGSVWLAFNCQGPIHERI